MPDVSDKPMRLLLVEDDPAQARLLAQVLRTGMGGRLEVAALTDPLEALEWIREQWADILVTDLDMPQISGLDVLRCAKSRNRSTQVIILTAHSTSESLVEAMDMGASDYLLKPVDHSLLLLLTSQAAERLHRWRASLAGTFIQNRRQPCSQ